MRWLLLASVFIFCFQTLAHAEDRPKDIVDLKNVDSSIMVRMMYATDTNFMGRKVKGYEANICYVTKAAGEGLKRAQAKLKALEKSSGRRLTLVVKDCYRPKRAVQDFVSWSADPKDISMKSVFYPDLSKPELIKQNYISPVSGHSRASSIDLTIASIDEGGQIELLPMGTIVDFFGERAHTDSKLADEDEHANRMLLKSILTPEFKNYPKEWWHYVLAKEPYPSTSFDFPITQTPPREPQSVATSDIVTQLSSAPLLAALDHDNSSPLSLVNVLKRIHESNGLKVPAFSAAERSNGKQLSLFNETYGKFSAVVASDVERLIKEFGIDWEKNIQKTYDVSAAKTPRGKVLRQNGNVTRIFNEQWLTSSTGQFLLSGVVNRIDRREFTPGTCGEVRFIYRLGYVTQMSGATYASRVPFTINMVFNYPDDGHQCREIAGLWNVASLKEEDPQLAMAKLLSGPVDFSKLKFKQLEMNAQVARFPSDLERMENRGFAGQAVYVMRIFALKDGVFFAKKLENTPDVENLVKNPALQTKLRDYVKQNLKQIDNGTYLLPDEFLTDVAITYSTLGSSRLANKPFDLVFKATDTQAILAGAPTDLKFIGDGHGLLERLNTSSCMGCHQASATAGFHFLGVDRTDFGPDSKALKTALDGNRLVLPFSPHLFSDLPRRAAYNASLVNGEAPNTFRPHPSAPAATWSSTAAPAYAQTGDNLPCPLPTDSSMKAKWQCAGTATCKGLVTNASVSTALGQCVPPANAIYSGLSCRSNDIKDGTAATTSPALLAFNVRSFTDALSSDKQIYGLSEEKIAAGVTNCRPTRIGVPLGRVTKACSSAQMALTNLPLDKTPNEICAIVGGKGFEEMARGYFSSAKFAAGVGRGVLNTCSPTRFCREDYICQEMPDFLGGSRFGVKSDVIKSLRERKIGFCTPTYFVYQLRLDGHPNP